MTDEQFHAKYDDLKVTFANFSGFPKPTFCFTGITPEGDCVAVSVGGSAEAVSLLNFGGQPVAVKDLQPFAATVYKYGTGGAPERWDE